MTFWYPKFSLKMNEKIQLYYYDTLGRLVFVCFLGEIEETKRTFRNKSNFNRAYLDTILKALSKLAALESSPMTDSWTDLSD